MGVPNNLSPESTPWAREQETELSRLRRDFDNLKLSVENNYRQQASGFQTLGAQIAAPLKFEEQTLVVGSSGYNSSQPATGLLSFFVPESFNVALVFCSTVSEGENTSGVAQTFISRVVGKINGTVSHLFSGTAPTVAIGAVGTPATTFIRQFAPLESGDRLDIIAEAFQSPGDGQMTIRMTCVVLYGKE